MKRLEEKHEALLKEKEVNINIIDKKYAFLLLVSVYDLAVLRIGVMSTISFSIIEIVMKENLVKSLHAVLLVSFTREDEVTELSSYVLVHVFHSGLSIP